MSDQNVNYVLYSDCGGHDRPFEPDQEQAARIEACAEGDEDRVPLFIQTHITFADFAWQLDHELDRAAKAQIEHNLAEGNFKFKVVCPEGTYFVFPKSDAEKLDPLHFLPYDDAQDFQRVDAF